MKHQTRIGALLAVLLIAVTAGCSLTRPQANEWGCTFGKGPWDSKGLKGQYAPGQGGDWTNDSFATGPSDVRFYIIDNDPATADAGGRPIVVPAKGSNVEDIGVVPVSVEAQVRMVFNERFCEWYINHGKRNEPLNFDGSGEGDGWNTFMNTSLNQKMIEAVRPVVAAERYDELYVNALIDGGRAYDVLAREMSENLGRELEADLGGQYFCGPSYEFDGTIDGELENGCPPMEVTIKNVVPTQAEFVTRLEDVVANEEEKLRIASDRDKELEAIAAREATTLRQVESDKEIELAEQSRREETETAKANADLEIREAEEAVVRQELENDTLRAEADAQFCILISQQGIDCALYEAAQAGVYPRIITGDSSVDLLVEP